MKLKTKNILLATALTTIFQPVNAAERIQLAMHNIDVYAEDVLVTAVPMTEPSVIETDPRITRQPLPAHDGADYLKTIPGFGKSGTSRITFFNFSSIIMLNMALFYQKFQL